LLQVQNDNGDQQNDFYHKNALARYEYKENVKERIKLNPYDPRKTNVLEKTQFFIIFA